jgi:ribosomal protein L20
MLNSRVFSRAKNAWMKAGLNAYIGRKRKKRDFRKLWNTRINIAARES